MIGQGGGSESVYLATRTCVITRLPEVATPNSRRKCRVIRGLIWAVHLAADIPYRLAVDAERQLGVSLLTVGHISHSFSQSGVFNQSLYPSS